MKVTAYTDNGSVGILQIGGQDVRLEGETEEQSIARINEIILTPEQIATAIIVENEDLPSSEFIQSYEISGNTVIVSMPSARDLYMSSIRLYRNKALGDLDATEIEAISKDDQTALTAVRAEKQVLRDLPANTDLSGYADAAALSAFWPTELGTKPY